MTTNIPRTRQSTPAREDIRTTPRETAALDRGVVIGRDGQPIRRMKTGSDKYHISPEEWPPGYVLEWKRHTILGQEDPTYEAELYQRGWRPVPADRYPGRWGSRDAKGSIIVGGQMLMELPIQFYEEAKADERAAANSQINGSREQFGFAPTASGFEGAGTSNNPAVRRNSFARSGTERVDAPKPRHQISVDDED